MRKIPTKFRLGRYPKARAAARVLWLEVFCRGVVYIDRSAPRLGSFWVIVGRYYFMEAVRICIFANCTPYIK